MNGECESLADDPRVLQAAREYLAILESGHAPDRELFLSRHPELAETLNECFDGIELAHAMKPAPLSMLQPAAPLGDFQIVREIARGGMGIVYEAIQLSLGRRVALKVLPFAAGLDERQLQRFKIEAHAAAQLHHTHIVPIYAVGSDRGVHYYAMQLIDGQSLSDLLAEWRQTRVSTTPTDRTSHVKGPLEEGETLAGEKSATVTNRKTRWRWAAQLMADVADALEFAHAAGVIHRDVKPANILVNDKGRAWIADFGLAHVATNASLTRSGELVGTLRYMSPEQAMGGQAQVDHRADIYSLGATLYELVNLTPIFPAEDRAALLYQILHDEPQPLRKIDRTIPVELETIVLKALSKSPSDRYVTAAEFAEDLRRFLSERPILARRPTWPDRIRKWLRRHPALVATAAMMLAIGTIGLAIATAVVWREQKLTQRSLERERERAQEAESRFEMARRVADELIQLAEDEALDEPFQEGLRTRLLETALHYYQEFIDERADRPSDQRVLQVTRDRVQQILDDLAVLRADRQFFLLREPAVLEDLQVTHEQRLELRQVLGDLPTNIGPEFGPPRPRLDREPVPGPNGIHHAGPPWMAREQLIDIARQHEAQLNQILSGAQLERVNQIALQCQGVTAFRDFTIVKRLELSPEQQEQIKVLRFRSEFQTGEPGFGASRPPWFGQNRRLAEEIVNTVFNDRQRVLWREMTGPPFTGELTMPGRAKRIGPP
ncbi:MAG TPA: serine/threonine-protein kinase [Pirellulaceae bacterium]|nr:serine/threonine-protein kinase [Pirellulaceae bacterium]